MGKYLAYGIANQIHVSIEKNLEHVEETQEKILENLRSFVNISDYNIQKNNDSVSLQLKEECITENIHDFVKEIYDFFGYLVVLEGLEVALDQFTKENCPVSIAEKDGMNYLVRKEDNACDNENTYSIDRFAYYNYVVFDSEFIYENKIELYIDFMIMDFEEDKIFTESEVNLLRYINLFSRDYFRNPLGKNSLFFITE